MAFLTADDYNNLIMDEDLDVVQQSSETNRQKAETTAIEYISSFLRNRYDVNAIFSASGDDRNPVIVMYTIDETLYNMHAAMQGRVIPETRIERKENLDRWLDKVNTGKLMPDLPLIDEETDPGNPIRYGGNQKVGSSW